MNERYARHISLAEVGMEGQEKLAMAKVLVVGAGGLGCPVLQYLTAAGVGTIGIIDFDTVSISNLQRQVIYNEQDVGKNKARTAKAYLESRNNEIFIEAYPIALTIENCLKILLQYDIVVDCTDNFTTRYLINDACCKLNTPMVYASLYKFEGQVAVFNYKDGPSYRCLFPEPPKEGEIPNCSAIGILGVLPGQIGVIQATEVLKIILELGEILSGQIVYINVLTNEHRSIGISRNEKIIKAIKSQDLTLIATRDCYIATTISLSEIKTDNDYMWIDVREEGELPKLEFKELLHMPLSKLKENIDVLKNTQNKIVWCQSGKRALKATQFMTEHHVTNVFALKEGAQTIQSWLKRNI